MSDKEEDPSSAYVTARGTVYITTKNLATALAGTLFMLFLARFLPSVSDFGLYNGLQILIAIVVIIAALGLNNAATRFIPYHVGGERLPQARQIAALILAIGLISSVVSAITLYLAADFLATAVFHDVRYVGLIHLTAIDVFFFSVVTLSGYLLYSFQEYKKVAVVQTANPMIRYAVALIFLILGLGIEGIIIGLICGDIVAFVIFALLLKSKIRPEGGTIREGISLLRTLLGFALPISGSQIIQTLTVSVDYYLVLSLSGLFAAGIYGPAVLIGSLYLAIIVGAGEPLLPYFSRIYGKSGLKSLNEVSVFTSRYVCFITFPLGFVILAASSSFITLGFGDRYSESVFPTIIIILTYTLISLGIVFNYVLMSAGYSRLFFISNSLALIFQILASVALIPEFGANGAAVARALAFSIIFSYPAYRLKKIAGLHYDRDALQKSLTGSVIMAIIILALNYFLSYPVYLPLNLMLGLLSYLVFLRFTRAMKMHDFEIFNNIFSSKFKMPIMFVARIATRSD